MATADDALNCCKATQALLNKLLEAMASFQDALNGLAARVSALEDEVGKEKHFDPFAKSDLAIVPAAPDVTEDEIKALAPNVKPVTEPDQAASSSQATTSPDQGPTPVA